MAEDDKIAVIGKWQPFIEQMSQKAISENNVHLKDSTFQMSMTMLSVISMKVAVDSCDKNEIVSRTASLAYAIKNIENDPNIDIHKRTQMARDLAKFINEQNDGFSKLCVCTIK